jgi:hypothetical protein
LAYELLRGQAKSRRSVTVLLRGSVAIRVIEATEARWGDFSDGGEAVEAVGIRDDQAR